MIVCYVDIGGIDDHYCLNFIFCVQWVKMRGDFCWYWWNCWPSLNELNRGVIFCWYWWWNCWPSLNELKWEVMFVDIGGIVDHHSMSWSEMWFCWYWWNCWPSLNEFRWEVIFVDIGGIVDHHSMSWSEMWFWFLVDIGRIVDHHSMN